MYNYNLRVDYQQTVNEPNRPREVAVEQLCRVPPLYGSQLLQACAAKLNRFSLVMGSVDVVVGTWTFSHDAVRVASQALGQGKAAVDALEMGINAVEDDEQTGRFFVGRGSYRNAVGRHQFDAALMVGCDSKFGGVAALSGFSRPFSVARSVLERSAHSMLVGEGAACFAEDHGFVKLSEESLDDEDSQRAWHRFQECGDSSLAWQASVPSDTLGALVRTADGCVAAGISTSGPPFKVVYWRPRCSPAALIYVRFALVLFAG